MQVQLDERHDDTTPTLAPGHVKTERELHVDIAAITDIGRTRDRNEDQYLVARLGRWAKIENTTVGVPKELTSPQGTLLVIADGMGGQGAGDVASAVTLDAFVAHSIVEMPWLVAGTPEGDRLVAADMTLLVAECQRRLQEIAERKGLSQRLGTTLTAGFLTRERIVLAHVGDTRAYLWRAGEIVRLTRDHTLAALIAGDATADSTTRGQNVLLNSIGGNADIPRPDMTSVTLQSGDRVLLCTDGLHGSVDDKRICELLGAAPDAQEAARGLVDEALLRGAPDNVTVVIAFG